MLVLVLGVDMVVVLGLGVDMVFVLGVVLAPSLDLGIVPQEEGQLKQTENAEFVVRVHQPFARSSPFLRGVG